MDTECRFDGCDKKPRGKGYCPGHYRQLRLGQELRVLASRTKNKGTVCTAPDCVLPAYSKHLCAGHKSQTERGQRLTPLGSVIPGRKSMYKGVACKFEGCEKNAVARGWCNSHAMQVRRGEEMHPLGWRPPVEPKVCAHEGCDKKAARRGLCYAHYRQKLYGNPRTKKQHPPGRRVDEVTGYVSVKVPGHPESKKNSGWAAEHRVVMSDSLGRPLWPDESVHHRNGDRADNRVSNLELWSRWQPVGQRVSDKVEFAEELLRRYKPQALR